MPNIANTLATVFPRASHIFASEVLARYHRLAFDAEGNIVNMTYEAVDILLSLFFGPITTVAFDAACAVAVAASTDKIPAPTAKLELARAGNTRLGSMGSLVPRPVFLLAKLSFLTVATFLSLGLGTGGGASLAGVITIAATVVFLAVATAVLVTRQYPSRAPNEVVVGADVTTGTENRINPLTQPLYILITAVPARLTTTVAGLALRHAGVAVVLGLAAIYVARGLLEQTPTSGELTPVWQALATLKVVVLVGVLFTSDLQHWLSAKIRGSRAPNLGALATTILSVIIGLIIGIIALILAKPFLSTVAGMGTAFVVTEGSAGVPYLQGLTPLVGALVATIPLAVALKVAPSRFLRAGVILGAGLLAATACADTLDASGLSEVRWLEIISLIMLLAGMVIKAISRPVRAAAASQERAVYDAGLDRKINLTAKISIWAVAVFWILVFVFSKYMAQAIVIRMVNENIFQFSFVVLAACPFLWGYRPSNKGGSSFGLAVASLGSVGFGMLAVALLGGLGGVGMGVEFVVLIVSAAFMLAHLESENKLLARAAPATVVMTQNRLYNFKKAAVMIFAMTFCAYLYANIIRQIYYYFHIGGITNDIQKNYMLDVLACPLFAYFGVVFRKVIADIVAKVRHSQAASLSSGIERGFGNNTRAFGTALIWAGILTCLCEVLPLSARDIWDAPAYLAGAVLFGLANVLYDRVSAKAASTARKVSFAGITGMKGSVGVTALVVISAAAGSALLVAAIAKFAFPVMLGTGLIAGLALSLILLLNFGYFLVRGDPEVKNIHQQQRQAGSSSARAARSARSRLNTLFSRRGSSGSPAIIVIAAIAGIIAVAGKIASFGIIPAVVVVTMFFAGVLFYYVTPEEPDYGRLRARIERLI
jgi:hypothetical protein